MLYVNTKLTISQDIHQSNEVIPVSDVFYSLCSRLQAIHMITLPAFPGKKCCLVFRAWGRD